VNTADTGGVLGGECCDDTCPIAVQRGEGLQVRLKKCRNQWTSQVHSVNPVPTWIPAPPEGSLPAMVKTVGKDMTLSKTAMSAKITSQHPAPRPEA
jgi:hypothetical protein